jgi:GNAT superfamily N-acetyltransferase
VNREFVEALQVEPFKREISNVIKLDWLVRLARDDDVAGIEELIPLSVRELKGSHYSTAQVEAALGSVFGVDRQLISDGTYYVIEKAPGDGRVSAGVAAAGKPPLPVHGATPVIVGCGGWSKRQTLFGSDHQTNRDDAELNPAEDSARIRAFFVHPGWARRGLGRAILNQCEKGIRAAGFKSIELAATLPGVPFYSACGYVCGERSDVPLKNGLSLAIVRMTKQL